MIWLGGLALRGACACGLASWFGLVVRLGDSASWSGFEGAV
jgi:hypothetical protein